MFRERELDFVARFDAARERGDREAATRCARDLKGVAGSLGMPALQRTAAALERACIMPGEAPALESLLKAVKRELELVLASLEEKDLA
jgi:HPt (histidine-containing phosphotransfer) domain-containing protein